MTSLVALFGVSPAISRPVRPLPIGVVAIHAVARPDGGGGRQDIRLNWPLGLDGGRAGCRDPDGRAVLGTRPGLLADIETEGAASIEADQLVITGRVAADTHKGDRFGSRTRVVVLFISPVTFDHATALPVLPCQVISTDTCAPADSASSLVSGDEGAACPDLSDRLLDEQAYDA